MSAVLWQVPVAVAAGTVRCTRPVRNAVRMATPGDTTGELVRLRGRMRHAAFVPRDKWTGRGMVTLITSALTKHAAMHRIAYPVVRLCKKRPKQATLLSYHIIGRSAIS